MTKHEWKIALSLFSAEAWRGLVLPVGSKEEGKSSCCTRCTDEQRRSRVAGDGIWDGIGGNICLDLDIRARCRCGGGLKVSESRYDLEVDLEDEGILREDEGKGDDNEVVDDGESDLRSDVDNEASRVFCVGGYEGEMLLVWRVSELDLSIEDITDAVLAASTGSYAGSIRAESSLDVEISDDDAFVTRGTSWGLEGIYIFTEEGDLSSVRVDCDEESVGPDSGSANGESELETHWLGDLIDAECSRSGVCVERDKWDCHNEVPVRIDG